MTIQKSLMAIIMVSFISCQSSEQYSEVEANEVITEEIEHEEALPKTLLKDALEAKKAKFEASASADKKEKYAAGLQFVIDNKIVESALQVGDKAPDFSLTNAAGVQVSLYNELENGPVILMWYRGGWCPYCNITLHSMQENLTEFKKYGANLLALTPELPDSSMSTAEKHSLDFQVLSDIDNKVANEYKVVFKLTNAVGNLYEDGFGLSQYNGNNDNELPLAATYIIAKDGTIKYAFLDADYRNRAEPTVIISVLKTLVD